VLFLLWVILLAFIAGLLALSFFGYYKVRSLIAKKRARELSQLKEYHQRLHIIVSELLSKANELDQESKYLNQPVDTKWSYSLAATCTELVELSNVLITIDTLITSRDIKETRKNIIQCLHISHRLHRQLSKSKIYVLRSKSDN
jgi:hypothetical protein